MNFEDAEALLPGLLKGKNSVRNDHFARREHGAGLVFPAYEAIRPIGMVAPMREEIPIKKLDLCIVGRCPLVDRNMTIHKGFAVGVISALLEGKSLTQAVSRGNKIGSLAIQVIGDSEGLPTRAALGE